MSGTTAYELLDFGDGRKLERFGGAVIDRPCPTADALRPSGGQIAAYCFDRTQADRGVWTTEGPLPDPWLFEHGKLKLQLRLADSGQVGVFPEQMQNWEWLDRQVRSRPRAKVLNLFAYTGAATFAAAAAGAEVVHVDAVRSTVAWARHNADISGLADRPIRWIVDDARKFVAREVKRGQHYEGIILDPPTYGHGPRGHAWQLTEHLPALLRDCGKLLSTRGRFLLLSCHAPGIGPSELTELLKPIPPMAQMESGPLELRTGDGRSLPSGVFARWSVDRLPADGQA